MGVFGFPLFGVPTLWVAVQKPQFLPSIIALKRIPKCLPSVGTREPKKEKIMLNRSIPKTCLHQEGRDNNKHNAEYKEGEIGNTPLNIKRER